MKPAKPLIEATLACMHAKVFMDEGEGWAEYRLPSSERRDLEITLHVGGSKEKERRVLSILLHETFEAYCDAMQLTWVQSYVAKQSSGNKLLILSHAQMDEALEDVAEFLLVVWPVVKKAWARWGKKGKA